MPTAPSTLNSPEDCAAFVAATGLPLMVKHPELGELHFLPDDKSTEWFANNPAAEPLQYAEIDGRVVHVFLIESPTNA